jgi:hypothetical protein
MAAGAQSQRDYYSLTNCTEFECGFRRWLQVGLYLNTEYTYAYRNGIDGTTGGPRQQHRFPVRSLSRPTRPSVSTPTGGGSRLHLEPAIGPYGYELEWKILLQKNFLDDRLVLASNIIFETEQEWQSGATEYDSILDLLVVAYYRFTDNWAIGVEFHNHCELSGQIRNEARALGLLPGTDDPLLGGVVVGKATNTSQYFSTGLSHHA